MYQLNHAEVVEMDRVARRLPEEETGDTLRHSGNGKE